MNAPTTVSSAENHHDWEKAFLEDFVTVSRFGATGRGGVHREAGSEADTEQRRWLASRLEEQGLRVRYDRIGNQFGLLELQPGAPYVLIGSHLDSQPTAGRFDGAYGVVAAAHVAFRLAAEWTETGTRPRFNLAVANWFNEEGSRFMPSVMGSMVYTGVLPLEHALAATDLKGVSVRDVLSDSGMCEEWDGPEPASAAEIHIEQGRTLEERGVPIGLVTGSWGANKFKVHVKGAQAHSGATIMADRQDALFGASLLIVAAYELAEQFGETLHTAVSRIEVYPNSQVTVASDVRLLLDLRSADSTVLADAVAAIEKRMSEIETEARVEIHHEISQSWSLTPYHAEGVELARRVVTELDIPHIDILTVAGHDSINLNTLTPTVMLFVPSRGGVTHNEAEETSDEDMVTGLRVLHGVVARLADGALVGSASS